MAPYRRVRRLSWPSRNEPEDGFTLVEVLVAMIIISTALLVLAGTMFTAFGAVGFSRQRDTATQLANQAMEQIKALNFSDLVMSVSDLTAPTTPTTTPDPLVTCTGGAAPCTFSGRTIPTVASGTLPPAPLSPHATITSPAVGTSSPGPSNYTISSYVTFDTNNNTQARVATVRVTWDHAVKGSSSSALVQIESTIFATGPLAVGTGHAWSASAVDNPGSISITGTLLGIPLANVQFGPGSANASIGGDGAASASATVAQNLLQVLGLSLESTPQSTAVATSGTGAAMSGPVTNVANDGGLLPAEAGGIISLLDTGSLGITGGVGNTGTTKAVAANSAAGAANLSGQTMPNSSLPYAQAEATQTGPLSLGVNLTLLGLLGGTTPLSLLSVTPLGNTNPDVATVCQQTSSGVGCHGATPTLPANLAAVAQPSYPGAAIVAQAQKNFLDISVLGGTLLDITGFTAAASAAAGPGLSNTGKSSTTAVTLSVLGVPITLVNGVIPPVSSTLKTVSSILGTVGVTASLTTGTATSTGNSALVTSPLILTVGVNLAGLLSLSINVNLGSVSASASYS